MKKHFFRALLLVLMLALALPCAAVAVDAPARESGDVRVFVNGEEVVWPDAAPFIDENDRTLVPLRPVGEAMGLEVVWRPEGRSATFLLEGEGCNAYNGLSYTYRDSITFTIDSTLAAWEELNHYENGSDDYGEWPVEMDTAAVIVDDRTYAPVRYLAERFGYAVRWDAAARTAYIDAAAA